MQITAIDISHHRHFVPPFRASCGSRPRHHADATLVRVETDAGLVGVGSGDWMLGFAGHEELFIGQDPLAIERHFRTLSHLASQGVQCWPLDLALWDLAGKITGQPCWKLLGGLSDRVRAYASSAAPHDPGAAAEVAEKALAAGFPALLIRFQGDDWRDGIRAVEAARARVGHRLHLMVDCRQGGHLAREAHAPWTLKDAVPVARELERLGVYWMEAPVARAGLRRLRDIGDIRIAGGDLTRDLGECRDLIMEGCLDVLQPDAARVGGITGLRRVAVMAQEHGMVVSPRNGGNAIGLIAHAHLAAGLSEAPYFQFPSDPLDGELSCGDDLLGAPCVADAQGWVVLSDAPGFGLVLDEDRLAATRIG